ncbi:hypothetical protein E4T47_04646 [Aureobasidium subglaciale]|nr:hypothetical protein E4T47_04646 [Aureobasidium subglaciale]
METMNNTMTASRIGIALSHNTSTAWSAFLVGMAGLSTDASTPTVDAGTSTDDEETVIDDVARCSWGYQVCSEFGCFPRGNPENPHTIQSKFTSLESEQKRCDIMFPDILPPEPAVWKIMKYGGWKMNPSNTMWTMGEFDPWTALSPASTLEDAPSRRSVQAIPDAGVPPPDDVFFGIVHEGMSHAKDLDIQHGNMFASNSSVSLFQKALEK